MKPSNKCKKISLFNNWKSIVRKFTQIKSNPHKIYHFSHTSPSFHHVNLYIFTTFFFMTKIYSQPWKIKDTPIQLKRWILTWMEKLRHQYPIPHIRKPGDFTQRCCLICETHLVKWKQALDVFVKHGTANFSRGEKTPLERQYVAALQNWG